MNPKQRFLTGMGVAAGLVAGGGAGLILQSTGSAGAAATAAVVAPPTTDGTTTTPIADGSGTATTPTPPKVGTRLQEILQPLIDEGTLTQAQVDAVIAKIDAARSAGEGRQGRAGRHEPGIRKLRGVRIEFDKVATLLGVSTADLRTALKDGTTLAAYAESNGKTGQDVIDLLVADTKTHLDAKVADGSLTQAKADTELVTATTFITDFVNSGRPARADRPARQAPADAPEAPATTVG